MWLAMLFYGSESLFFQTLENKFSLSVNIFQILSDKISKCTLWPEYVDRYLCAPLEQNMTVKNNQENIFLIIYVAFISKYKII